MAKINGIYRDDEGELLVVLTVSKNVSEYVIARGIPRLYYSNKAINEFLKKKYTECLYFDNISEKTLRDYAYLGQIEDGIAQWLIINNIKKVFQF